MGGGHEESSSRLVSKGSEAIAKVLYHSQCKRGERTAYKETVMLDLKS